MESTCLYYTALFNSHHFRPVHYSCCGDPEAVHAGHHIGPRMPQECLQCKYNFRQKYPAFTDDFLQILKFEEKQCFCQGMETIYSMAMSLGKLICPSNALNTARQGKKVSYKKNDAGAKASGFSGVSEPAKEELTLEFQGEVLHCNVLFLAMNCSCLQ